jgi:hypothetical protein
MPAHYGSRKYDALGQLTLQTRKFLDAVKTAGGNIESGLAKTLDKSLVRPLLSSGLWDTITAFYPYIGGSAAAHSINLKTPGTYSLTFTGGITHNANGITNDGSTGWVNTNMPQNVLAQDSTHSMAYVRTQASYAASLNIYGATGSSFSLLVNTTPRVGGRINDLSGYSATNATVLGFIEGNRTSATSRNFTMGGVTETSTQASTAPSANNIAMFSSTSTGSVSTVSANVAAASLGLSHTAAQIAAYSAIIQSYESALGRAV